MTNIEKALLDTIAYAEGTLGVSNNGYDVVVTFKVINGWTEDTKIVHGDGDWRQKEVNSNAAGRYQFLGSTWKGNMNGRKNAPMTKDNQDKGALFLINYRLKNTNLDTRPLTISEITTKEKFTIFFNKCTTEWTSFPRKGVNELWEVFQLALSKY